MACNSGWKDLPNNARVGQMIRAQALRFSQPVAVSQVQPKATQAEPDVNRQLIAGCDRGYAAAMQALEACRDAGCGLPGFDMSAEAYNKRTQFQRGFVTGWTHAAAGAPNNCVAVFAPTGDVPSASYP